jgi:chromosomal replication initiator protein
MNSENQKIWAEVLGDLARRVRPELVGDWLADLELTSYSPGAVAVTAPSPLHAKLVEDHYGNLIAEGFEHVFGQRPQVQISSRHRGSTPSATAEAEQSAPVAALNPSFSLDEFIEGSSNRLALAACRAVVDRPGDLYNPLFVHGTSGTGKTHLLQAVCRELSPRLRVIYLTADELASRVAAGREDAAALRTELRSAQVLALDDVQTLQGREASQEELFHAFNALYNRNGQVLFAADKPPRKLAGLPERLTSRFTWGLTVEIEPPLFENRLEILASKAAARGATFAPDVLEELAAAKISNVRELEGLLARLIARSSLDADAPERDLARQLASSATEEGRPDQAPSVESILRVVAGAYSLRPHDLLGPSRTRSVAIARHVAIYLVKSLTDLPIQEIGGHFGGRDHSTVNYAINKISRLVEEDDALAKTVRRLNRQLTDGSGKRVGT